MNLGLLVLTLVGVVWTLQGANVLKGSVMSGQLFWLYAGVLLAIAGLASLVWFNTRRTLGSAHGPLPRQRPPEGRSSRRP